MAAIRAQSAGWALVTGASRGIGREVALRLAGSGYSIVVHYRASQDQAEDALRVIRKRGGDGLLVASDLSDATAAAELVRYVESEIGPLRILINNAGITRDRLLLQMTEQDWDATWMTDLSGARAAARAALHFMMARRAGSIVNVSSVVGAIGNAGQANYAAAKSALHGVTRELAVQGGTHGVSVNCVIPGYIVTDATAHLTDRQREAWIARIPMRRSATPQEVAETVVFLAAVQTGYITGQCIAVDGGLLAAAGFGLAS